MAKRSAEVIARMMQRSRATRQRTAAIHAEARATLQAREQPSPVLSVVREASQAEAHGPAEVSRGVFVAPYTVQGCALLVAVDSRGDRITEHVLMPGDECEDVLARLHAALDRIDPRVTTERATIERDTRRTAARNGLALIVVKPVQQQSVSAVRDRKQA